VNQIENDRLERAVERLMDRQLKAMGVVRSALDGSAAPTKEDVLVDLPDILEGGYQDTRSLGGYRRTGRGMIVHKEPYAPAAVDRFLRERWRGKVRQGGAGSRRPESLFAPVFTIYSGDDEVWTEREDNAEANKSL
jgi:hypothetical protein